MKWLWPIETGKTLFDVWSVVHFAFWLIMGANLSAAGMLYTRALLVSFAVASAWEVFERYGEKHWPHLWKHQEIWVNSWLSDVLLMVPLGLAVGYWLERHQ